MNRLTNQAIIKLCHDVQIGIGGMDYADTLTAIGEELTLRGEQEAWIPVTERMPKKRDWYLITDGKRIDVGMLLKGTTFMGHALKFSAVTHWQEPPQLPIAPPLPYQEEKETGR